MRSKLLTIFVTAVVTALLTGGGVLLLQQSGGSVKNATANTQNNQAVDQKVNNPGEAREISAHGYVIADQLFFSPDLGLSLTGTLKTLKFENNTFTATDWPGTIQVFKKKPGQDILDAIREVISNEGKNPDDCDFNTTEADGNAIVAIMAKLPYEPTEAELFAVRQKSNPEVKTLSDYREYCKTSPECSWERDGLIQENNQKYCSKYAISTGYHDGSYFQYATENNGSDTFIYAHDDVGGGDRSWIGHIYLFPKE